MSRDELICEIAEAIAGDTCDATGDDHVTLSEGRYRFCIKCGETIRGRPMTILDAKRRARAALSVLTPLLKRVAEGMEPFAAIANPRHPDEGGSPSWIDLWTEDGTDELALRSHVGSFDHEEILEADSFRTASALHQELKGLLS
jgi:hypothetical protein